MRRRCIGVGIGATHKERSNQAAYWERLKLGHGLNDKKRGRVPNWDPNTRMHLKVGRGHEAELAVLVATPPPVLRSTRTQSPHRSARSERVSTRASQRSPVSSMCSWLPSRDWFETASVPGPGPES